MRSHQNSRLEPEWVKKKEVEVANTEHLSTLEQGVENWNEWRIANSSVRPDLSGANLKGANLSSANLSDANLSRADLRATNLSSANLRGADLIDVNLFDANLTGTNLSSANLLSAVLIDTNLSSANLRGANLRVTNLFGANLSSANLFGANLKGANLSRVNLRGANLVKANLSNVDCSDANLSSANLSGSNLKGFNFSNIDCSGAKLIDVNLSGATLINTNLSGVNLSNALLIASQFLGSNLTAATLTGACIQDWNINSATQLDDVICKYVYLKGEWSNQKRKCLLSDRRPSDPDCIFAPGEFSKLFQKALETVDLIFGDGIDWKAFFQSFQELRSQYDDDDLSIQAIEKKSGGAFVIRLEVPAEADKGAIESRAKELYERELQLLETQYRAELHAKEREIESYRRESTNMMEIAKLLASKPITVEAKAVAENQSNSDTFNTDLRHANVGNFANKVQDNARQQTNQHIYASPEKQSLAEAMAEIQTLLKQLDQTNPTATKADKKTFVTAAIPVTRRQRAVGALQAGGKTAIAEFLENPYVNVAIAIVEGWRDAGA